MRNKKARMLRSIALGLTLNKPEAERFVYRQLKRAYRETGDIGEAYLLMAERAKRHVR